MATKMVRNALSRAMISTTSRTMNKMTSQSFSTVAATAAAVSAAGRVSVCGNQHRCFSQEMKDEYGEMTADGDSYLKKNFVLENQVVLPEAELRYQTYGTLNEARDNVLVVCHALTGNASLHGWWGDLLGENKAFDTSKYFVICCNILGSCYGSTNPQSIDPRTGAPYGSDFPDISVKDTARLQLLLMKEELGISSIKAVIGGSFGGMQTMEFAVQGGSSLGEFRSHDGTTIVVFICVDNRRRNFSSP